MEHNIKNLQVNDIVLLDDITKVKIVHITSSGLFSRISTIEDVTNSWDVMTRRLNKIKT